MSQLLKPGLYLRPGFYLRIYGRFLHKADAELIYRCHQRQLTAGVSCSGQAAPVEPPTPQCVAEGCTAEGR